MTNTTRIVSIYLFQFDDQNECLVSLNHRYSLNLNTFSSKVIVLNANVNFSILIETWMDILLTDIETIKHLRLKIQIYQILHRNI